MHQDQQIIEIIDIRLKKVTNEAYIYLDIYEYRVSFRYVLYVSCKILDIVIVIFYYFSDFEYFSLENKMITAINFFDSKTDTIPIHAVYQYVERGETVEG